MEAMVFFTCVSCAFHLLGRAVALGTENLPTATHTLIAVNRHVRAVGCSKGK